MSTTTERLRANAETAALKAAEAQRLVDEADAQQRAAEAERQAEADRATLNAYSASTLNRQVDDALHALKEVINEMPLTQALAAHLTAINARSWAYADAQAAASRLGAPTHGWAYPDTTQPVLVDLITAAAGQMAQQATTASRHPQEG